MFAAALADGYTTRLVEPNDDLPVPTLLVAFDADDEGRERTLGISFMPFEDGQFVATEFVQFYVRLPFEVPAERRTEVQAAATIVTASLAIGHFALRGDELYYRYVLASPSGGVVDGNLLAELVQLLDFHQDRFADYLEGVVTDNISLRVLPQVLEASLA
ncbi:MAG: hypothetical protein WD011_04110 [Nitriliruptoraceae bacterium]